MNAERIRQVTEEACSVAVSNGLLRGVVVDGVSRFLGVPYAAPPFGENRFQLPRPHSPWEGIRDATTYGPTPPQAPYQSALKDFLPSVIIPGEEILNLNVWSPAGASPSAPVPVMVWFYGGALTRGANALLTYDGSAFARDGVVLVAVNYRVGAEGFSVLKGAPRNAGLADQVAALEWVRAEILKFGGDPGDVTIFGQSAGGGSVATLLASKRAEGLFTKAIIMSAPLGLRSADHPGKITELIAKDLGVEPTLEAFVAIPPETLVAVQTRLMDSGSILKPSAGYGAAVGDDLVPVDPWSATEAGNGAQIPVLLGYTEEEMGLYLQPHQELRKYAWLLIVAIAARFRLSPRAVLRYRRNRPGATGLQVLGALITDAVMRVPVYKLASLRRSQGATTYVYEFAWRTKMGNLGAAHGLDVAFVFDTLDSGEADAFAGPDRPRSLASEMHSAWVSFAKTGQPGWAEWDESRPVMIFNTPASAVTNAPRDDEHRAVEHVSL